MGMLILTRRIDEDIVFPTLGVVVRIMDIRGDRARLGIAASRDIPVHRREVWDEIVEAGEAPPAPELAPPSAGAH